ncbi:MAG TPA: ABC transporter permease [Clostridiales bacterium]|jgi:magnesium-transporting ATPase (P-type)|nr:ABC transporter permease [Clostridiales bacterium]
MLARLMKYEIKSTARLFIPLYAVLLIFALLNRFLNPFETLEAAESFSIQILLRGLSIGAYFFLIIAVFVITLVIIIQRFYKNLLGDEGYLMFTLPMKPWQHIANKLLTAILWCVFSVTVITGSFFILFDSGQIFEFLNYLKDSIKQTFGTAGFLVLPTLVIAQLTAGLMMLYNAMALGQLFQKNRLLASFGMYCALYSIQQVIYVICLLLLANTSFLSLIRTGAPAPWDMNLFLGTLAISGFLLAAAHFVVVNYVLNTKLNLD